MSNDFWYGFLLGAGLVLLTAIVTVRLRLAGKTGKK
jgi:hypothetical protein